MVNFESMLHLGTRGHFFIESQAAALRVRALAKTFAVVTVALMLFASAA
jgi:hypothetical protein